MCRAESVVFWPSCLVLAEADWPLASQVHRSWSRLYPAEKWATVAYSGQIKPCLVTTGAFEWEKSTGVVNCRVRGLICNWKIKIYLASLMIYLKEKYSHIFWPHFSSMVHRSTFSYVFPATYFQLLAATAELMEPHQWWAGWRRVFPIILLGSTSCLCLSASDWELKLAAPLLLQTIQLTYSTTGGTVSVPICR